METERPLDTYYNLFPVYLIEDYRCIVYNQLNKYHSP